MKQRKSKKKNVEYFEDTTQDENFYYIAGYTSSGFPFGITWEQAEEDGLIDGKSDKLVAEIDAEDLPF